MSTSALPFLPGQIILYFNHRGTLTTGRVESCWGCDATGAPVETSPDHFRYFVFPFENNTQLPGHELVLPSSQPRLLDEPATNETVFES